MSNAPWRPTNWSSGRREIHHWAGPRRVGRTSRREPMGPTLFYEYAGSWFVAYLDRMGA